MRDRLKPIAAAALAATAWLLTPGASNAQQVSDRTFKVAFVQDKDHPHGVGAQRFADILDQKSGGKIKVRLFGSGQLGGDAQVISSLQGGTVEMTMVSPGSLAGMAKEYAMLDLPFLFNSYKEVDAVLDGPIGRKLLDTLPNRGLIGLGWWDHGFRILTNSRRPVAKMEDIQGLKVRVQQIPASIDMFNGLGANAVPMSYTELYTALETKAVDGQENPFAAIEISKLYEVQKYASTTQHVYNPLAVVFSKRVWDRLSPDERKMVQDAANEAGAYERQVSREMNEKSKENLQAKGMIITEITPEERDRMRAKLKPVNDKYVKEVGEDLVKEMMAAIDQVRKTQ
ncbi:MAG TPA: TRAP transporter substrate-binding protein [Sphingomicrobium sp.]|jgi:tripartite ATP-independent transporter DctP family solute receptor|nr:TRAP transporter substrate-binding protein [Sphingomicrobium sp.]